MTEPDDRNRQWTKPVLWQIQQAALALANYDAAQVDCPPLGSVEEFRLDRDRKTYEARAEAALQPVMLAVADALDAQDAELATLRDYRTNAQRTIATLQRDNAASGALLVRYRDALVRVRDVVELTHDGTERARAALSRIAGMVREGLDRG